MSSIFLKRGVYYYDGSFLDDGERVRVCKSLRTKNRAEAERLRTEWDEFYECKSAKMTPESPRVSAKIDQYLAHRERLVDDGELSYYTFHSDRTALRHFSLARGEKPVAEITIDDLTDLQNARLRHVSKTTVATQLRHLQSFFSWLYERKEIEEHPFNGFKIPKSPRREAIPLEAEWRQLGAYLELKLKERRPHWIWFLIAIQ